VGLVFYTMPYRRLFFPACLNRPPARRLLAAAVVALATGAGLPAQPTDLPNATLRARAAPVLTLYIENDSFTGSDQHYTSGLKVSWLSADLVDWGQHGWRKRFVDLLPFVNRPGGQKNFGFALGQNIYTPRDATRANPDPADRPYAGWTYLELAFVSKTSAVSDRLSLQAGVVGPSSLAKESQRTVHRWIGSVRPEGWDYQLRNEAGVNVGYERRWRLYARALVQSCQGPAMSPMPAPRSATKGRLVTERLVRNVFPSRKISRATARPSAVPKPKRLKLRSSATRGSRSSVGEPPTLPRRASCTPKSLGRLSPKRSVPPALA
jgi:hypothetical protein